MFLAKCLYELRAHQNGVPEMWKVQQEEARTIQPSKEKCSPRQLIDWPGEQAVANNLHCGDDSLTNRQKK